jgi:hypothetical protein
VLISCLFIIIVFPVFSSRWRYRLEYINSLRFFCLIQQINYIGSWISEIYIKFNQNPSQETSCTTQTDTETGDIAELVGVLLFVSGNVSEILCAVTGGRENACWTYDCCVQEATGRCADVHKCDCTVSGMCPYAVTTLLDDQPVPGMGGILFPSLSTNNCTSYSLACVLSIYRK